jgi:hypothetical protein
MLFRLMSQYFWLLALAFAAFNYARARKSITESVPSDRIAEASALLKRFAVVGVLPWVVVGAGHILGFTPTIWLYFRPQDGNPFVIAWIGVSFLIACGYAYWVLFAGGAEKVWDLRLMAAFGQLNPQRQQSLGSIKFLAGFGPFFLIAWVVLVVCMDAQLPK